MPLLSVLTAVADELSGYISETAESLAGQSLPDGWRLEWIVQEDGPNPRLAELVGAYQFARYEANGEQLGIAATRNIGLARLNGSMLYVLDGDDVLLPGGLRAVLQTFDEYADIHWVATQADDLMPNGTRVRVDPISATGRIDARAANDYLLAKKRGPFLLNGMAMRTDTVRALGGWVATPNREDHALAAGICELTPGYYLPEVTWLWRQHDRQTTRRSEFLAREQLAYRIILQRIGALRETGIRLGGDRTGLGQP